MQRSAHQAINYLAQRDAGHIYQDFVNSADKYGLPVKFLRRVGRDYRIGLGDDATNTWLNTIEFSGETLGDVKGLEPSRFRMTSGISTVYHEATHAYLDLVENDPKVKAFIAGGEAHYVGAPLEGGKTTSDPKRVFQEAAASYVGNRAATWWTAFEMLSIYAAMGKLGTEQVNDIHKDYDSAMSRLVFGYSDEGGFLGLGAHQAYTTRPITVPMKDFLDHELLEDKIPDHFDDEAGFIKIVAGAAVPLGGPGVQKKPAGMQSKAPGVDGAVAGALATTSQRLPPDVVAFFGDQLGYDFSDVRIHADARAASSADVLGARAYTLGEHIVFGHGRYAPNTLAGVELLAHELAHVVQQSGSLTQGKIQRRSLATDEPIRRAEWGYGPMPPDNAGVGGPPPAPALTSSRFSGDPQLAEVAAGRLRLAAPGTGPYPAPMLSTGPPVAKVQQALMELGYDLGATGPHADGVDGIYGAKTAAAVRLFKADNQLGYEQFGDVGPGTMGRLDILFPDVTPQDDSALKDDPSSCPFDDEAVVKQAVSGPQAHALMAAVPGGSPGSYGPIGPWTLDDYVEQFKAAVNVDSPATDMAEENLTQTGQFFWARQIKIAIEQQLDSLAADPDPLASSFAWRGREAVLVICQCLEGKRASAQAQEISAIFTDLSKDAHRTKSPQKSVLRSLLAAKPEPAALIEAHLYGALKKENKDQPLQLPNLDRLRSLPTLRAVYRYACTSCGDAAWQAVQLLLARGGLKPRTANAPKSYPLAAPRAIRNLLPGPGRDTLLGDVIFQTGVAESVARMKVAIDGGHQIHARVLSGVGYGHDPLQPDSSATPYWQPKAPPEEHSLIIIGYEGDSFVFNDPDAGASKHPERGFGMLFYDSAANRLSTAKTTSMLYVTSAPFGNASVPFGNHYSGDTEGDKRYQVVKLFPFTETA